ncbi:hypothetical protein EI94DRAFT_1707533 [Lactarius quietus]|nr:hypothetical protein EI94DRAFT_1707533 [Lactarius quietus]
MDSQKRKAILRRKHSRSDGRKGPLGLVINPVQLTLRKTELYDTKFDKTPACRPRPTTTNTMRLHLLACDPKIKRRTWPQEKRTATANLKNAGLPITIERYPRRCRPEHGSRIGVCDFNTALGSGVRRLGFIDMHQASDERGCRLSLEMTAEFVRSTCITGKVNKSEEADKRAIPSLTDAAIWLQLLSHHDRTISIADSFPLLLPFTLYPNFASRFCTQMHDNNGGNMRGA